ncbi:MAG: protein-glutamate O-methyltransferase CheR [Spirochaetia bacterium]
MESQLDKILARVREDSGIDLGCYRPAVVDRRLAARMSKLGLTDPTAYLQRLETDPSECDRLIDAVGINVSSFFRDPLVFEIISKRVLPEIIERKRSMSSREIRIWSAGCAAGQEAYTLAILVHLAVKGDVVNWTPHIFATDMDGSALEAAHVAAYPRTSFETTKLAIIDEYFTSRGTGFEVRPVIKNMVRFSRHDLTSAATTTPADSVFGTFDLTLCRNVLIYLSHDTQTRVVANLCKSVADGGYLVLGESETLNRGPELQMDTVDKKSRIYQKSMRPARSPRSDFAGGNRQ